MPKTHGMSHIAGWKSPAHPTYLSWVRMKQRCLNPRAADYSRYGGRGITVCDRWDTFENFLADMGQRPARHVLDRINNDGHYQPDNCRWVTIRESCRNRSSSKRVTINGVTRTLVEWGEVTGLGELFAGRILAGWSPVEAAATPKDARYVGTAKLTDEAVRSIRKDPRLHSAIGRDHGVDKSTVARIKRGESYRRVKT